MRVWSIMTERVYKISDENAPIEGLTISKASSISKISKITYFSLGEGTDISPEAYSNLQMYIVNGGEGVFKVGNKEKLNVKEGDMIIVPPNRLCGVSTQKGLVYTEIIPGKDVNMNKIIKAGEVLKIAELLPYKKDSIVNMDVVSNDSMKYVLMAFDEGTGLTPHRAPGDAIVFALDGKAVIGYEGKDYEIKAGEQFRFEKGGLHSVTADGKFKMALLLVF